MSTTSKNRIPIKGNEREALPEAHITGAIDPHERLQGFRCKKSGFVTKLSIIRS